MNINNIKTLVVHGGSFHADDVLCGALLRYLIPELRILRVNEVTDEMKLDSSIIICDIGYGEFDHHQSDVALRDDGRKHAACGLLFDQIGDLIFTDEAGKESFRQNYIIPVEDQDNGYCYNPLSLAIRSMNPCLKEKTSDEAYEDAVEFILNVIRHEALRVNRLSEIRRSIDSNTKLVINDDIRVLKKFVPMNAFIGTGTRLVIYKSNRDGYNISAVKESENSMAVVQSLPKNWLYDKPNGCTFVHQGLFIAAFDTEENAIAAILKEVER